MRIQLVRAEHAEAGDVDHRNQPGVVLREDSGIVTPNAALVFLTPSAGSVVMLLLLK